MHDNPNNNPNSTKFKQKKEKLNFFIHKILKLKNKSKNFLLEF